MFFVTFVFINSPPAFLTLRTIRMISRDAFAPSQQDSPNAPSPPLFFKARVLLKDTRLKVSADPVRLLPGMTVTAEIKVGRRTVISYFLYPVIRTLDDSVREP